MKKFASLFLTVVLVLACVFALAACDNTASSNDEDSVKLIYNRVFENDKVVGYSVVDLEPRRTNIVEIPSKHNGKAVTSIGIHAFEDCINLTDVTLPDSITSIGKYAFSGCENLTTINIPNSITSIGRYAFEDCESLTNITLPNNLTSIEAAAFHGCSSLTSIIIPNSITSVEIFAFDNCSKLTYFYYQGTESQANKMDIDINSRLQIQKLYYYSETKPTTEGNYWHYVDNIPTAWKN